MNGFRLHVDDNEQCGRKIKVLAMPFSKSIMFDTADIHELASLLSEDNSYDGVNTNSYMSKLLVKNQILQQTGGSRKLTDESVSDQNNSNEKSNVQPFNPIRLPKLAAMFASRACRSAIMIGTALNQNQMKSIVTNLEIIEQPWNCPHGRPTMRHLVDFKQIYQKRLLAKRVSNFLSYEGPKF